MDVSKSFAVLCACIIGIFIIYIYLDIFILFNISLDTTMVIKDSEALKQLETKYVEGIITNKYYTKGTGIFSDSSYDIELNNSDIKSITKDDFNKVKIGDKVNLTYKIYKYDYIIRSGESNILINVENEVT
jgi:hypothetical protein